MLRIDPGQLGDKNNDLLKCFTKYQSMIKTIGIFKETLPKINMFNGLLLTFLMLKNNNDI